MYIENKTFEATGLEVGKTYWVYMVGEVMATTIKAQIKIKSVKTTDYAQYKNVIMIEAVEKGKRKSGSIILKNSMLFLDTNETEVPLSIDTDFNRFSGNGLLNFVSEVPEELRRFIKDKNRFKFSNMGIITFRSEKDLHNAIMLFPELADTSHAVVRTIMESWKE